MKADPMPDASQLATYARLLRLTPLNEVALPQGGESASEPLPQPQRRRWSKGIISLLLLVAVPSCLAAGYFWLLAADRFESEARFVLRTPGRTVPNAQLGNLMQKTGVGRANDDGYLVKEYLESRDAMKWLEEHTGLRAALTAAGGDPAWKFPNLFTSDTEEGLYRHYRRMISTDFDPSSGLSVLKVQAFTSADAQRLVASLLKAAEVLINRLNERARHDATALAAKEVEIARHRALAAQAAVTSFRERERLIDPSQVTLAVLETIAQLAAEAAQASVQISELGQSSPNSPQISALRSRRAALEKQIATERQRLAGDALAIAPRIAEYEGLMLEREFAEKTLMAALTAVEMARAEALRQQVYLEIVAAPGNPDYPSYPWKVIWFFAVVAAGYMAWRMWRTLAADALRHNET